MRRREFLKLLAQGVPVALAAAEVAPRFFFDFGKNAGPHTIWFDPPLVANYPSHGLGTLQFDEAGRMWRYVQFPKGGVVGGIVSIDEEYRARLFDSTYEMNKPTALGFADVDFKPGEFGFVMVSGPINGLVEVVK